MHKKYRAVQHKDGRRYVISYYVYSNGQQSEPRMCFEYEQVAPDWFRAKVVGGRRWFAGAPSVSGLIKMLMEV